MLLQLVFERHIWFDNWELVESLYNPIAQPASARFVRMRARESSVARRVKIRHDFIENHCSSDNSPEKNDFVARKE